MQPTAPPIRKQWHGRPPPLRAIRARRCRARDDVHIRDVHNTSGRPAAHRAGLRLGWGAGTPLAESRRGRQLTRRACSSGAPGPETRRRRSASRRSRRSRRREASRSSPSSGSALSATTGIPRRPRVVTQRSRATSVPSMSGSRRSMRIDVRQLLGRRARSPRRRLPPRACGTRPRAARPGRASGSSALSSTIRTSGRRHRGGRTGVSSAHVDSARARRGPLPRPRGHPAPARDATRPRDRGRLRRPRLAARRGRGGAAGRRRHRHPHAAE